MEKKQPQTPKLSVKKTSLRALTSNDLRNVQGGRDPFKVNGSAACSGTAGI